jgi:uncharacterized membrane protein
MERIERFPPVKWSLVHPRLAAWIVLSLGMVVLLVYEARDVGLKFGNWVALIVATVLVAGACILIVSWEDEDEADSAEQKEKDADTVTEEEAPADSPSDDVPESE